MFRNLLESTHHNQPKEQRNYLLTVAIVWIVILAATVVQGITSTNIELNDQQPEPIVYLPPAPIAKSTLCLRNNRLNNRQQARQTFSQSYFSILKNVPTSLAENKPEKTLPVEYGIPCTLPGSVNQR